MKATRVVAIAAVLLATGAVAADAHGWAILNGGGCVPGAAYDAACDVNHDGTVDVTDIQLTAGHWGQSGAYVILPVPLPRTGQTATYGASDDGALRNGVPWPVPRFTDNLDGTVTDHLMGLTWLQNAICGGAKTWPDALVFANSLHDGWTGDGSGGDCNLSDGSASGDWRLPNVRESHSLIDFSRRTPALPQPHPFTNVVEDGKFWSSTSYVVTTDAWSVNLDDGTLGVDVKDNANFVWPVRGGQ